MKTHAMSHPLHVYGITITSIITEVHAIQEVHPTQEVHITPHEG